MIGKLLPTNVIRIFKAFSGGECPALAIGLPNHLRTVSTRVTSEQLKAHLKYARLPGFIRIGIAECRIALPMNYIRHRAASGQGPVDALACAFAAAAKEAKDA